MARDIAPLPQADRTSGLGAPSHAIPPKPWRQGPAGGQWDTAGKTERKDTEKGSVLGESNLQFTIAPWGLSFLPIPSGQSGRVVISLRTG